ECSASGDCAAPAPYCHPVLKTCVECLSSLNCAAGLACDPVTGTCTGCNDDGDCSQARPYCSAEHLCVECRTKTNCREGVQCVKGVCGTCGDGVCSSRERVQDLEGDFGVRDFDVCPEDCR